MYIRTSSLFRIRSRQKSQQICLHFSTCLIFITGLECDLTDFNKWRDDERDQAEEACSFVHLSLQRKETGSQNYVLIMYLMMI